VSSGKLATAARCGALALVVVGCAARRPAPVVFMSDFGTADDSVAICKGVMLGIEPALRIVDLTHEVRPFSVRDGARLLAGTAPYYPPGAVFLAVVDPGVGGPRKAIVVASGRGQYFVVPDNGLVTLVAERDGMRGAREIANPAWTGDAARSSTFHGRDVFAPVAARLARGEDWTGVGPPLADVVRIEIGGVRSDKAGISGLVIGVDGPYGNLITNVAGDDFRRLGWKVGDTVPAKIDGRNFLVPFAKTFGDVPVGRPLLYIDSRGRVAMAVNQGHFAKTYRVEPPVSVMIPRKGR
jgi:S-adenosylmethionine hydrolase